MTTLTASQTRIPAIVFNRVAHEQERVRIDRRGGKSVFLISEEDFALLEEWEDRYWADEGVKALREFEKSGKKSIPYEKIKAELGL